ncbi:hypothetical protein J6590_090230 [Homalodisca vitripennis]|nr:hypothetical protein J6590_098814 [Homalodisca vitripennis]KAG8324525.1 hypothetical protein J6590_090230 [Homalodisca vitripennis]
MDLLKFRITLAETLISRQLNTRPVYHNEDSDEKGNSKPQNWRAPMPGIDKRVEYLHGCAEWKVALPEVESSVRSAMCILI